MADQQVKITISAIDNATKALNDVKNSLTGIGKETKATTAGFLTFRNVILGTAGIALYQLTKQIIQATSKFQDLRSNLISATGSIQDGGNAFSYLKKYAKESQFSVEELTGAYLTLYQNGVTPTEQTLKTLVTVAGESSNKIETLTALVNLFSKGSQDATIGVQALNVLLKNNIPVYDILRNKVGGSTDSINSLFGSTTTAQIALKGLLEGLSERATKASDRTENLSTKMGIFNKTIQETLASFGETKALNYFFDSLTQGLERNKPLLEFLGSLLAGLINVIAFILSTAQKVMNEFFDIFVISITPIKNMATAIYDKLTPAFKWATETIDSLTKSWEKLKSKFAIGMGAQNLIKVENTPMEMFGMGTLPEAKKPIDTSSTLEKTIRASQIELIKVLDTFEKISDIISKGIATGIKDVSKTLAESIVLGKSLQTSFRDIAQNLLVKIMSGLIEQNLIKLALLALDKISSILGIEQLYTEKLKTIELEKQARLKKQINGDTVTQEVKPEEMAKEQLSKIIDTLYSKLTESFDTVLGSIKTIFGEIGTFTNEILGGLSKSIGEIITSLASNLSSILGSLGGGSSGGGGFLGSLINFGIGAFGGGGMTPIDASVVSPFAEGGAVRGGMPISVGERGRELFVPSTDGNIVPNHDLDNSGKNITFNIQANDVRGIRELLIDNRATIINLVNQGANQKGRSNVV